MNKMTYTYQPSVTPDSADRITSIGTPNRRVRVTFDDELIQRRSNSRPEWVNNDVIFTPNKKITDWQKEIEDE